MSAGSSRIRMMRGSMSLHSREHTSSVGTRLIRAYDEWLRSLDPSKRRSTSTFGSFASIAVMATAGMAVMAYVPGLREFFHLRFWHGAMWLVLALLPGFVMAPLEAKGLLSLRAFGAFSLVGVLLFNWYMWTLVLLTDMPGSTVMAAFPVLLVSFHGYLYQSSIRRPFALVASLLAFAPAMYVARTGDHLAVLAIAGPMALASHLLLGYYSNLEYGARAHQEALRHAVDAQILRERTADIARASDILMELRGRSHDAGNALSGLLLNLPHFVALAERKEPTGDEREEAATLGRLLGKSLLRLKTILTETQEINRKNAPSADEVHPDAISREVADEVRRLHPGVIIDVASSGDAAYTRLRFFGGTEALRRVVHNLVLNACQGDGRRSAESVHIHLAVDEDSREMILRVLDDGPGFREDQLRSRFDRLETSKTGGLGVGFYTASRIVAASGGHLERANRTGEYRGAAVTARLRLDIGTE